MILEELKSFLIVDDSKFICSLLSKLLIALTGLPKESIDIAENGKYGIEYLKNRKPDIIFCDLNMPGVDGVEFLRMASEITTDPYIVIMTGEHNDILTSVKTMSIAYGFKNVMTLDKPFKADVLNRLINEIKVKIREEKEKKLASKSKQINKYQFSLLELFKAITGNQMIPFYQPHISSKTKKIVGAEALIRWNHKYFGILSPYIFLNQFTEAGLSSILTNYMIENAIKDCKQWHIMGYQISVSVNCNPSDLVEKNFVEDIMSILEKYRLSPKYLTIEITETELVSDVARILDSVNRLRMKGISISIDDFGTGHSSLMQLIVNPFSELKVDMSFVQNMFNDDKSMAAVNASLSLSKAIGLRTVAEGVESKDHVDYFSSLDQEIIIQGYYYSQPIPNEKFIDFMEEYND